MQPSREGQGAQVQGCWAPHGSWVNGGCLNFHASHEGISRHQFRKVGFLFLVWQVGTLPSELKTLELKTLASRPHSW